MTKLEIECRLEAIRCQREGFVAENTYRTAQMMAPAYRDDAFIGLSNDALELTKEINPT